MGNRGVPEEENQSEPTEQIPKVIILKNFHGGMVGKTRNYILKQYEPRNTNSE